MNGRKALCKQPRSYCTWWNCSASCVASAIGKHDVIKATSTTYNKQQTLHENQRLFIIWISVKRTNTAINWHFARYIMTDKFFGSKHICRYDRNDRMGRIGSIVNFLIKGMIVHSQQWDFTTWAFGRNYGFDERLKANICL